MDVLICIDDTDNLDSRGTGDLASEIARDIEKHGWGTCSFISRHQLLVHPDIPYTSHNSAMCFSADVPAAHLEDVIRYAGAYLAMESATGSDPGLCVAVMEHFQHHQALIEFGCRAKQVVITMDEAYQLAQLLGVHLSGHGGTEQGIIGALAGAGLRLSGNDGRLKGHIRIEMNQERSASVSHICTNSVIDEVRSLSGQQPMATDLIQLDEKLKAVLLDGKAVLLVTPLEVASNGAAWRSCSKQQLRSY